jgi:hypothetical protein
MNQAKKKFELSVSSLMKDFEKTQGTRSGKLSIPLTTMPDMI